MRSALLCLAFAVVSFLVGGVRPEESSAARNSLHFPCQCYADLLEEALRIPFAPARQRTQTEIQDAVHDALDAVIGFDFSPPRSMGSSTNPGDGVRPPLPLLFGNIRGAHHEGSEAIVEAARDGMCQAILSRNLNAIEPPLEAFWAAHPDFHPAHTGRLYPHGHPEYEVAVGESIDGQIDALRRIVFGLLNDGLPLCGNDFREGEEECDGGDAATCGSGICDPDCSCGFIPD